MNQMTVISISGTKEQKIDVPEIFTAKVNKTLLAQAVRVYRQRERQGTQSTKTRSEVIGSTRKIYRQKGTGNARHGARKAPIFVGGGVAFGPKPFAPEPVLPRTMRQKALISALSRRHADGAITVVDGLADVAGKTKKLYSVIQKIRDDKKQHSVLLVLHQPQPQILLAGRNIVGLQMIPDNQVNAYNLMQYRHILIEKTALAVINEGTKKQAETNKPEIMEVKTVAVEKGAKKKATKAKTTITKKVEVKKVSKKSAKTSK